MIDHRRLFRLIPRWIHAPCSDLYGLFMLFYKLIFNGLWTLWVKGRAVDNGFIVIHGKRPGSPQANYPQVHSLFCWDSSCCWANEWCKLGSDKELRWRGDSGDLPSSKGQTV